MDENQDQDRIEGRPLMTAAVALGVLGLLFFGAAALIVLLVPHPLRLGHWIFGGSLAAFAGVILPWQMLDARSRRCILTGNSLIHCSGVLTRREIEIPFTSIQAVTVRQGILQRIFHCGDVRVAVQGVSDGLPLSSAHLNSISIRSIANFREVGDRLRAGMKK